MDSRYGKKSSMNLYRSSKDEIGVTFGLYDNREGSSLLANCRAGMLYTNKLKAKIDTEQNVNCDLCGEDVESIEHVVIECKYIGRRTVTLETALGFGETINWNELNITKCRLTNWRYEKLKIGNTNVAEAQG